MPINDAICISKDQIINIIDIFEQVILMK